MKNNLINLQETLLMAFFSREQQIERYAKIMAFWDKNMPGSISNFDLEKFDPYLMAKYFFIADKRSQTLHKIMSFDEDIQDEITERLNELLDQK